jgi:hypothetical protein
VLGLPVSADFFARERAPRAIGRLLVSVAGGRRLLLVGPLRACVLRQRGYGQGRESYERADENHRRDTHIEFLHLETGGFSEEDFGDFWSAAAYRADHHPPAWRQAFNAALRAVNERQSRDRVR